MNVYLFAAVILLLPALCTALGAAGVFLVRRADEPRTRRMLCGMAAGIMLAASVWSLLLPAIERAEATLEEAREKAEKKLAEEKGGAV